MSIAILAVSFAILSFIAIMIFAGLMDLMTMTIDNRLIVTLALVCAVCAPVAGFTIEELGYSLLAALLVFFVSVAFYVLGWIGGGDGKLATVTALWMGADHTWQYISYVALFGGLLTVFLLMFRTVNLPLAWQGKYWVARLHSPKTGVPYGVALALAGLYAIKDTAWIANMI